MLAAVSLFVCRNASVSAIMAAGAVTWIFTAGGSHTRPRLCRWVEMTFIFYIDIISCPFPRLTSSDIDAVLSFGPPSKYRLNVSISDTSSISAAEPPC